MNANFRMGTDPAPRRLASLASRKDLPPRIRAEALFALGHWAEPPARDRLVGVYRPLSARDPAPARAALAEALPGLLEKASHSEELMTAAMDAAARLSLSNAAPAIATLVRDTSAPSTVRAAALRAYTRLDPDRSVVSTLLASAAADSSEPLRLAAFKLNAELNPQDALGQMASRLAQGTLAEQQTAYAALAELNSDAADALLADALDRLMRREIANEVVLDLIEAAAKRPTDAVKSRLAAYQDWKLPKDALSPYRETLYGGDAARGRRIFYENAAVACTRCHQIGSDGGGNAGPKLDGLATRTTPEHWLESVVFPNQQVVQGFESALITLKDGQSYAGVVKSETNETLILIAPEEGEIPLKKSDIASREKGLSGMPEGLGQLLTRHELRDLIAFLGTLK
jgi:quinoprotein glucose dehydrogenase